MSWTTVKAPGDPMLSDDWNKHVAATLRIQKNKIERHLNDNDLFFRGEGDDNHGIGWRESFGADDCEIDGPVLYGYRGGALGVHLGPDPTLQKAVLEWAATQVTLRADLAVRGTVTAEGETQAYSFKALSDAREKTDVQELVDSLDRLHRIRGVRYRWRSDEGSRPGEAQIGVIAQEVREAFPELVSEYGDHGQRLAVSYDGLAAVLVEAVKQLHRRVIELEHQLASDRPEPSTEVG